MKRVVSRLFLTILCLLPFVAKSQQKIVSQGLEVVDDAQKIADEAEQWIQKIDGAFEKVRTSNTYKTLVDGKSLEFPFGILPDGGDANYALVVNKVDIDPVNGMYAEMFMKIPYSSEKHLYFLADKVPLSKSGKLLGELNLFLMKKATFSMGKGYELDFKGLDNPDKAFSYVTFTCDGFKELFLNGALRLNKDAVETAEDGKELNLDFFVNADKASNLIVEFNNIPDLEFKSLPGFKCSVPKITLDRSDNRNAPKFNLPSWYLDSLKSKEPTLDPTIYGSTLWEGLYIPSVAIQIPKKFSEGSDTTGSAKMDIKDTSATAEKSGVDESGAVVIRSTDLIVDQYGITALTKVTGKTDDDPVLAGNLKGFKYQIDSLRINIIANTLSKAGFYGEMSFPICKEDSRVEYGLTMSKAMTDDELAYNGYARFDRELNVKAFGLAQIQLTTCDLEFEYKNKQFFPAVTMDGSLTVAPKKKGETSSGGGLGLEFEGLKLMSDNPYVTLVNGGGVRLKTGNNSSKLGNLPISLAKPPGIKNGANGQRVGLELSVNVSFQKSSGNSESSGNGFGGTADLIIWAKRNPTQKRWEYDDLDLTAIAIEVNNKAFKLKGSIKMFNEPPPIGKGFCGSLDLTVIEKFEVNGACMFGKSSAVPEPTAEEIQALIDAGQSVSFPENKDDTDQDYRYWFVDAQVSFSPAITIFSGVDLNGFTGGLYYNMEMQPGIGPATDVFCKSASGRGFDPRKGVFGLLAGIGIQSTGGGSAYNGDINFGLEFFLGGGGLKRIATWGGVGFFSGDFIPPEMAEVAKTMDTEEAGDGKKDELAAKEPENSSSVKVNWYVEYDFPNKTFTGDFDIYVDVAGVIKGIGTNAKAGHIAIYASPSEWYVYVGKPAADDMIGLDVLGLVKIGGYMCFGSVLPTPPMAPMPPEIKPNINIDYNVLNVGGGFSFGARLELGGDKRINLGLCKAYVELTFIVKSGFDILLSKANEPIYCKGEKRGINDWYATGQAYIYGEAGLGAGWDCWLFGSKSFDLFSMYLSAYVFAQLPKPSYFNGGVTVGFRVLKKNWSKNFKVEFGETCSAATEETDVNFIEAINPADSTLEVNVGEKIQVYFSRPLEKFEYSIQNSKDATGVYRGYCDDDLVSITANGQDIVFSYEMSPDFTQMTLTPQQVLPEASDITVQVTVVTQQKSGSSWTNTAKTEVKAVTFTTKAEPAYIPSKDIYYAYPIPEMDNFYKQESTQGFIRLAVLPVKAVKLHPDYEFTIGFYEGNNEIDRSRNVSYTATYGENNFEFDLPTNRLDPGKKYTMKIMKSPKPTFTNETSTTTGTNETGTVDKGYTDSTIVDYDFTVSLFPTFQEKMSLFSPSLSEVFDGVVSADLSVNNLQDLEGVSYEGMTELETVGYILEGIQVTDPFIQFGELQYNSTSLAAIQSSIGSQSPVHIKNNDASSGYQMVSSLVSDLNDGLKEVNLNCLLDGGCSEEQVEVVRIPAGKFQLPIGYHLPGEDNPTSTYNLVIDLDNEIVLPF